MTAKEYLSQIKKIDHEIEEKKTELEYLRGRAENCSAPEITGMPKTPSGEDKISGIIIKIVDLEHYIGVRINELIDTKRIISSQIDDLPDSGQRGILWSRYVLGRKWEEIADKTGYSTQSCYRLHKKALAAFGQIHRNYLRNKR